MIEPVKPARVKVTKQGQEECYGAVTHYVFRDIPDPKNPVAPIKGEFLGLGVRLDSGHEIYCQRDQVCAPDAPRPEVA